MWIWIVVLAIVTAACGDADTGSGTSSGPEDGADNGTTAPAETVATDPPGEAAPTTTEPLATLRGLDLEVLATGLAQPTVLASPPDDDRIFIGLREGVVRIYDLEEGLLETPFLNIPDRVASNGIEQGLLGLAFHPDYQSNGRFFIYHTDRDQQRQLAEYRVSDDPNIADIEDAVALYDRAQPPESSDIRHYGGNLIFGPDGYLYISSGDGAASKVTGQEVDDYFGALLRIDVDSGDGYTTPADNPFVGEGEDAAAVWAYGLRNPWRFTIDNGLVYIADVGQGDLEEINVVSLDEPGANFGWPTMEGTACFIPSDCDKTGLVQPVYEYDHGEGCSITGGHVYRGAAIPELQGHYFFADWCGGWIRSLVIEDGAVATVRDWSSDLGAVGSVNGFGVGPDGELYLVTHEGTFAKIVPLR